MKTYFIKVINSSDRRGYNRTIEVYIQMRDKSFYLIGENSEINTASYRGDYAVACKILHDKLHYRWSKEDRHYSLLSKNIKLLFLP